MPKHFLTCVWYHDETMMQEAKQQLTHTFSRCPDSPCPAQQERGGTIKAPPLGGGEVGGLGETAPLSPLQQMS